MFLPVALLSDVFLNTTMIFSFQIEMAGVTSDDTVWGLRTQVCDLHQIMISQLLFYFINHKLTMLIVTQKCFKIRTYVQTLSIDLWLTVKITFLSEELVSEWWSFPVNLYSHRYQDCNHSTTQKKIRFSFSTSVTVQVKWYQSDPITQLCRYKTLLSFKTFNTNVYISNYKHLGSFKF